MSGLLGLILTISAAAANAAPVAFTVRDSIEREALLDIEGYTPGSDVAELALFSPDRKHFVVRTRRGDVARNVFIERLYVLAAKDEPAPQPLAHLDIEAHHDRAAVSSIQWISNSAIGYLAQDGSGVRQAYAFDLPTGATKQLTHSPMHVAAFGVAGDHIVYFANTARPHERLIDATGKALQDVLFGFTDPYFTPLETYHEELSTGRRHLVSAPRFILQPYLWRISVSPDGRHAVTFTSAANVPAAWSEYRLAKLFESVFVPGNVQSDHASMTLESTPRLQLIDLRTNGAMPLLDAPSGFLAWNRDDLRTWWAPERNSVIVTNTYLPLTGTTGEERARRAETPAIAEIDLADRSVHRVAWLRPSHRADGAPATSARLMEWDEKRQVVTIRGGDANRAADASYGARGSRWQQVSTPARSRDAFEIRLRSGLNEPPRLVRQDRSCRCERTLFDPAPELTRHFSFGRAEAITWTDANHIEWHAALIMPPNAQPGAKYPLIVQTHGFDPQEFLVDGPYGITTAMAAQPLANAGFAVLQIDESSAATTSDQREAGLFVEGMRAGIRTVLARGAIDEHRIGVVAFSRTGLHAVQLVAEEPNLFAAVVTADAPWFGYVQDQLFMSGSGPATREYHALTAGKQGTRSIAEAAALDPLYRVAASRAAWRIEANHPASLIAYWELYTALQRAGRPVEVAYYPEATHVLLMPDERLASQQGTVDWFRRWLQR